MKKSKNTDYKKINLREFRHKFSELKDSIHAGQIYQVTDRNSVLGYFVPEGYEFKKVENKKLSQDEFSKLARSLRGKFKLREIKKNIDPDDYNEIYRQMLIEKYIRT